MKEMVYSTERKKEILDEGDYEGYHYVILSLSKFPTAYVERKKEMLRDDLYEIKCHHGITWNGYAHWNENDKRNYIGWDYGHLDDYQLFSDGHENIGDKYTTEEIYKEVQSVIKQLKKMEE